MDCQTIWQCSSFIIPFNLLSALLQLAAKHLCKFWESRCLLPFALLSDHFVVFAFLHFFLFKEGWWKGQSILNVLMKCSKKGLCNVLYFADGKDNPIWRANTNNSCTGASRAAASLRWPKMQKFSQNKNHHLQTGWTCPYWK